MIEVLLGVILLSPVAALGAFWLTLHLWLSRYEDPVDRFLASVWLVYAMILVAMFLVCVVANRVLRALRIREIPCVG